MTLVEYKQEIKTQIMFQFKNISEAEIDAGLAKNEDFIRACFNLEQTVQHVVHELTI